MGLVNLKSDLSEFFKKEPSKPTGRFQQPDKDMSDLDVHGKLETYKRPEIKTDPSGNSIVKTTLDSPNTKKRYTDNFESQLLQMRSVDINENHLTGRFESVHKSPVKVNEIETQGNNETSLTEHPQTNPTGRNEQSQVVIPEMDPTGRFTVSGIDPVISTLKGRFETSDIKPIESILSGRHAKQDNAGIELVPNENDITITNTTTFGIQNIDEEGPAIYQLGKAVNFDGTLVDIDDSDSHTFSERPLKSPTLYSGHNLSGTSFNISAPFDFSNTSTADSAYTGGYFARYSTLLNTINDGNFNIISMPISTTTGTSNTISSNLAANNVQYGAGQSPENNFWTSEEIFPINQPFRIGSLIDTTSEVDDAVRSKYTTDLATIGFMEPDGVTFQSLQVAVGSVGMPIVSYELQVPTPQSSHIVDFGTGYYNLQAGTLHDYGILNTIDTSIGKGQSYTIMPTSNSPYSSVFVTGMIEGKISDAYTAISTSLTGLDMVQSFLVEGQDTIVAIPESTITGIKNAYDISYASDSDVLEVPLFGGKTLTQEGKLDEFNTVTLSDQISVGIRNFEPLMQQIFGVDGQEGSNYDGIEDGKYTTGGVSDTYSYKTLFESSFGTDVSPGSSNAGTPTPISYDIDNHLVPGTSFTFTQNQSGPINYASIDEIGDFKFNDDFNGPKATRVRYIHQLSAYGTEEHIRGLDGLTSAETNTLPNLYNGGIGAVYNVLPTGDSSTDFSANFSTSTIGEGERYEKFMRDQIISGKQSAWWSSTFPALTGKLLTAAEDGIAALGKIMKTKNKDRIWETHNSFTTEGNNGLHRGLAHYGTLAPNNDINKKNLMAGWFPEINVESVAPNKTANKYYSVLGYPGLMVASAIADAGAISVFDFRTLVNDPNAQLFGDPNIANYPIRGLQVRGGSYDQGRPGRLRRDYRKPVTNVGAHGGDAITQQQISGVSIKKLEREWGDLIKFYIQVPKPAGGSDILRFRAYVTNLNDSLGATWSSTRYIGRPNNLFTYDGAGDRKISFNLKVAALSRYDVTMMWRKINNLMSLNYPHVDPSSNQMIGPVVGLTLGDYFNNEPGFFDSINITVDPSSPWEVNFEDPRHKGSSLGEKAINAFNKGGGLKGGGFGALKDAAIGGLKDAAKNFVTNQELDVKGRQVAQLPHVVDIVLSFTSMATTARRYGGPMFGAWRNDGEWVTNKAGYSFPKKSALDLLTGKAAGGFAAGLGGKVLRGALGGKI